jgi:FkbM family methyltransferase
MMSSLGSRANQFALKFFVRRIKNDPKLREHLFSSLREELVDCADDYPSVINNGFLHIEKVMNLARYFKLKESNAIVDVGGAGGVISGIFSQHFPNARVYAFEPIKKTFEGLVERTRGNPQITAINKGLGSRADTLSIHVASRPTASSIFQMEEKINNEYFAENLREVRSEQITISTLDDEIPSDIEVNIIKIDVQGYELEVLRGGLSTLKRTAIVILELQNHELYVDAPKYYELDSFLREQDFNLYNIVPSIRQHKKLYEWDGIYVHRRISDVHMT